MYSVVDEHWRIDPNKVSLVNRIIEGIPDLYLSIRLGGQAILGGTTEALNEAIETLPKIEGADHFHLNPYTLHSIHH